MKRRGFYTLQVTRVFSPQPKQLSNMKKRVNIVIFMNCDLLELEVPDSYKKTYCDWASFRFF